jgi:uncharacterized protein (DUF2384 family)
MLSGQTTTTLRYPHSVGQEELAVFVSEAVEQAFVRCDRTADAPALLSAARIADIFVATVTCLSPEHQRAIEVTGDQLSGLMLKFILSLSDKGPSIPRTGANGRESSLSPSPNLDPAGTSSRKNRDETSCFEAMLIEDWAGRVAGQTFLEKNFCIPRSTLHWWQRRNDVIALRKGERKHVFPLAQFVDGRPAAGIRDVLSYIESSRLAWFWLTRPSQALDGRVPIEMLKQDLVTEVISAAREFASK